MFSSKKVYTPIVPPSTAVYRIYNVLQMMVILISHKEGVTRRGYKSGYCLTGRLFHFVGKRNADNVLADRERRKQCSRIMNLDYSSGVRCS